jgi:leucyl aminopeptidase
VECLKLISLDTPLHPNLLPADHAGPLPLSLLLLHEGAWADWLAAQPASVRDWLTQQAYRPERARCIAIPAAVAAGATSYIAGLGASADFDLWLPAAVADRLPPGDYRLSATLPAPAATRFVLGWLLGSYRFTRYRRADAPARRARLQVPAEAQLDYALAAAEATQLARDLINTPANDMGPAELESAAKALCERHLGQLQVVRDEPLRTGYPLIEAVGRGSPRAARLLDLRFARPGAPRVTLVGKGVCFDTGGLDIKPSAGMLLMKKDMGGGACALGLAHLLCELGAPVELRVLIPAVENSVDGHAFRPGDVLRSRKGLTVEIGNTDAEGRLVLADALTEACSESPDLLVDLATLTGAARVALGPELPAAFCGDPQLLCALQHEGTAQGDPLWPMPLWGAYEEDLSSRVADLNNASSSGFAGAITAALFLKRFVTDPARWIHVDLYGWNPKERPGRPVGGEAQVIRALYGLIRQRYG